MSVFSILIRVVNRLTQLQMQKIDGTSDIECLGEGPRGEHYAFYDVETDDGLKEALGCWRR